MIFSLSVFEFRHVQNCFNIVRGVCVCVCDTEGGNKDIHSGTGITEGCESCGAGN